MTREYDSLKTELLEAEARLIFLTEQLEKEKRLNAWLESQYFELKYNRKKTLTPFNDKDITKLLILCHPDKNNQSKLSLEMTQKILQLKEG